VSIFSGGGALKLTPVAPFGVRSFRFQWPADLLASWAFEMETLILGWFVLVETDSVFYLTLFGALQYLGTLLAPFFGVAGDRLGRRTMMCAMRAFYLVLACVIMALALTDVLRPAHIFPIAFLVGLVRPSDVVMRNSLIGDTMPPGMLMNALGLSRMTMDTARIIGALAGAGLFAALGIGPAYLFVVSFYALSFLLSLGVSGVYPARTEQVEEGIWASRWRDLRDGIAYAWNTPTVLGLLWVAFLVNFAAIPMSHGLLPYVAKSVYGIDETGLSHLIAAFAGGALIGSVMMAVTGGARRPARFMIVNMAIWFCLLAIFARVDTKAAGLPLLAAIGVCYSHSMISLSGALLPAIDERFRARVMGIRMLAVYGLPMGLLAAGPVIASLGYPAAVTLYAAIGLIFTAFIGYRWRRHLWG